MEQKRLFAFCGVFVNAYRTAAAIVALVIVACERAETTQPPPPVPKPPYDLQFLDSMSMHHKHGIEMASRGSEKADSDALRTVAGSMRVHLTEEIEQMQALRERWYRGAADARNMNLPGAAFMRSMDASLMTEQSGQAFDVAFVDMMVPHHQGAIAMAEDAMVKAQHAEVRALARAIAEREQREIETLLRWKRRWQR